MTVEQIIENAHRRTDRRAEKTLDMKAELLSCIQTFCQEQRWFWRRKSVVLNTAADGTYEYDLTGDPTNVDDFEQVAQAGLKVFDTNGCPIAQIFPEFDPSQQEILEEDQSLGTPCKYWFNGDDATIKLNPRPNAVLRIRIPYWALPSVDDPTTLTGQVPLVPNRYHHIVQKLLEAQICRYCISESPARYQTSLGEYKDLVKKATIAQNFAPGAREEWRDMDCEDAVQST